MPRGLDAVNLTPSISLARGLLVTRMQPVVEHDGRLLLQFPHPLLDQALSEMGEHAGAYRGEFEQMGPKYMAAFAAARA